MELRVFTVVLLAALFHAGWNAIIKKGRDTLLTTLLVAVSAASIAAVALPFVEAPKRESWPFIAASTAFQVGYFALVARAYRLVDMSLAYPLMRGTAPLLVALASVAWIGDVPLSTPAWLAIVTICAGILSMLAAVGPGARPKGMLLALANAAVIACYTLIDGIGVRRAGAAAGYTLWIFLLTGAVLGAWGLLGRRAQLLDYMQRNWRSAAIGGVGTTCSYGLVLWAMTVAPVAMVAALRETSILFGAAISAKLLHERLGRARIVGACIVAVGAIMLRMA